MLPDVDEEEACERDRSALMLVTNTALFLMPASSMGIQCKIKQAAPPHWQPSSYLAACRHGCRNLLPSSGKTQVACSKLESQQAHQLADCRAAPHRPKPGQRSSSLSQQCLIVLVTRQQALIRAEPRFVQQTAEVTHLHDGAGQLNGSQP